MNRMKNLRPCLLLLVYVTAVMTVMPSVADASPAGPPATPTHAKLSYRRVFKSSSPEFIEIVVHDDTDAATYEIR